jgi:regulator of replication initiation timing
MMQMVHGQELHKVHQEKKQIYRELDSVKAQYGYVLTENEVLNLKVRALEDQV